MEVGDVVEYQASRWRVYKADRQVRTLTLRREDGFLEEVEDDHPDLKRLFSPSKWPFVTAPLHPSAGRISKVYRPRGLDLNELRPLVDWVLSDPVRPGGAIFMSPRLRLSRGDTLLIEHVSGKRTRVVISEGFGSMELRRKRKEKAVEEPRTLGDSLVEDFMADD